MPHTGSPADIAAPCGVSARFPSSAGPLGRAPTWRPPLVSWYLFVSFVLISLRLRINLDLLAPASTLPDIKAAPVVIHSVDPPRVPVNMTAPRPASSAHLAACICDNICLSAAIVISIAAARSKPARSNCVYSFQSISAMGVRSLSSGSVTVVPTWRLWIRFKETDRFLKWHELAAEIAADTTPHFIGRPDAVFC